MKKVYKMEDLDCANCAAKMERAIHKIDGVNAASVNFLTQRLAIEADESGFCAGVMKGNTSLQEFINEKIAEYKESGKISEWYVEATEKASELGIE